MMKKINIITKYTFLLLSAFALMTGCSSVEAYNDSDTAFVKLAFSEDLDPVVTKADGDIIYRLDIINSNGVVILSYENHKEIGDGITMAPGAYTFRASYGNDVQAGFETPYYEGSTQTVIKAGENSVSIICYLANVKVSVTTSNTVKEKYTVFEASISNLDFVSDNQLNPEATLVFDYQTESAKKAGYFKHTGMLVYSLRFVDNSGEAKTLKGVINDVEPRDYYKLNFSAVESDNEGGALIEVTIDETTNEKNWYFVVDIDPSETPGISSEDFDLNEPILFTSADTTPVEINFSAPSQIYALNVSHTSDYIESLGVPKSFNVLSLDDDMAEAIADAGITCTVDNMGRAFGISSMTMEFTDLLADLPDGNYDFSFVVEDLQSRKVYQDVRFVVEAGKEADALIIFGSSDAWAKFANLTARWEGGSTPEGLGFRYKVATGTEWVTLSGADVTIGDGVFSARATYLQPGTTYEVKAFSSVMESSVVTFTTEMDAQVPNMGFEDWYFKSGNAILGGKYTIYYPFLENGEKCWDTGNEGGKKLAMIPTTQETSFVRSGSSAAKLASKKYGTTFAAGSIYTGEFGEATVLPVGAKLSFGRPYTSRPSQLTGYYSYKSGIIDFAKDDYSNLKNTPDECHIYIVLADWGAPFQVNTGKDVFIDPVKDEKIIAYGELITSESNPDAYKKFEIDFEYRSDRKPTHIVIVASCSRYGDYFTGSTSSVLYLDDLALEFDDEGVIFRP